MNTETGTPTSLYRHWYDLGECLDCDRTGDVEVHDDGSVRCHICGAEEGVRVYR